MPFQQQRHGHHERFRHMRLRQWQDDGLRRFLGVSRDFLVVATPGAGKTAFALLAAQAMMDRGEIGWITVVVPTDHLKGQWAKAAARQGIKLNPVFTNAKKRTAPDYDGVVTTYQSVAADPGVWDGMSNQPSRPCLVILDEVHHAGDSEHLAWGPALLTAFGGVHRRLMLSGTPFRTDAKPIPFLRYDEERRVIPDINYDYGMALQDQEVVRPVVFPALDGEARWRLASEHAVSRKLSETDPRTISHALSAALDPGKDWIPSVLRRANDELSLIRQDTPDIGGLVLASNRQHARAYAEILQEITDESATVVISDAPSASKRIFEFAANSSRWIVAVQMVAEGVDIPRLGVIVYATRTRTELFFRQVVGRCIRRRGDDDELCARVFIPTIQPLLDPAARIELTVQHVLRDEEDRVRTRQAVGESAAASENPPPALPRRLEVIGSSQSVHPYTINSGETFGEGILLNARRLGREAGLPASAEPSAIVRLMRLAGNRIGDGRPWPVVKEQTLAERKKELRAVVNRKVGHLAVLTRQPHRNIHLRLHSEFGEGNIEQATLDTLNERLILLDGWIDEAKSPGGQQGEIWPST
ncbi:DEAD/DEAH box helicase [Streptomyces sp. NPDC087525]|uniref:DEAD/DEAH box helicase n=1 Tax=Streptomyces sp. NPDC087525 TaxID=3365793 RepID=UPI00380C85EE